MKTVPNPIKLVLADDHQLFRQGLKHILEQLPIQRLQVVAEASNGKELVDVVDAHKPDIVLTDIKMPVMDGIEASKIILKRHAHISIIALTMFGEEASVIKMLEIGAKGYLLKTTNQEEIIAAIQAVQNKKVYYSSFTSSLLEALADAEDDKHKDIRFVAQEKCIMRLICKQFTTKQIAHALNLSTRTIDDYRHKIQEKIDAKNMVGIALYALKNGIIDYTELNQSV